MVYFTSRQVQFEKTGKITIKEDRKRTTLIPNSRIDAVGVKTESKTKDLQRSSVLETKCAKQKQKNRSFKTQQTQTTTDCADLQKNKLNIHIHLNDSHIYIHLNNSHIHIHLNNSHIHIHLNSLHIHIH